MTGAFPSQLRAGTQEGSTRPSCDFFIERASVGNLPARGRSLAPKVRA